ncbi:unnamed protein product [Diabrotica balteata]|uniref:Uncharacterized protein n=1 Tax=Diabrotica balteata TaxID=107213 RepID=A0A9N9T5K3_DIABA|nr:unnamed protein product [Diabrotica balteata]
MMLTIIAFLIQIAFSVSALHPSYSVFLQKPAVTDIIQNIPVSYHSSGVSGGNSYFGNYARSNFPAQPIPDPSTLGCGNPPASCPSTRYRSYDGSCNNFRNPILGTPNTPYTRLLPQNYGDVLRSPLNLTFHLNMEYWEIFESGEETCIICGAAGETYLTEEELEAKRMTLSFISCSNNKQVALDSFRKEIDSSESGSGIGRRSILPNK